MMLFKVGDEVRVRQPTNLFHSELGKVVSIDHVKLTYKVIFHRGGSDVYTCFDLILVERQEETSMKFKVGDKVKVSDSWDGHNGEVGEINEYNNGCEFEYCVKFDGECKEAFRETELELVSEKQSFTKSDLKTGMGVVLRDGSKGHVLLDTEAGDVIRLIDGDNHEWMSTKDYDSEMCDSDMDRLDIMEVYSSHLAYCYVTERLFTVSNQVYKREEPKPEPTKMTMKEINEHFGKAIEIVE